MTELTVNLTVEQAIEKLPPVLKKQMSQNLCVCNEVIKRDIIKAIVNGAKTVDEVKRKTYASMGSGCCKQQIERLIECIAE